MPPSNVSLSYGTISFAAEGEESWVAAQLDKILSAAPTLISAVPSTPPKSQDQVKSSGASAVGTLAAHIKAKKGESVQNARFLATADWLRAKGVSPLNTSVVTKALSENQQKRLGNAAECLNQNVRKGFCEKDGDNFYITPEGLKTLGYSD